MILSRDDVSTGGHSSLRKSMIKTGAIAWVLAAVFTTNAVAQEQTEVFVLSSLHQYHGA